MNALHKKTFSIIFASLILIFGLLGCELKDKESKSDQASDNNPSLENTTFFTEGLQFYDISDNSCEVNGYIGTELNVVIPSQYNGKNVVAIDGFAFLNNTFIKTVTVGENISTIGTKAFSGCNSLRKIKLGSHIETIDEDAFSGCNQIVDVHFSGDIATWCRISFGNSLSTPLLSHGDLYINNELATEIVIPDTVESIKKFSFNYWNGTKITLSNSITTIDDCAFSNCLNLTDITLPESLKKIGNSAFTNCTCLTSISIPNSLSTIGYNAFSGCRGLTYNYYDNCYYLGNEINPYLLLVKATETTITSVEINDSTRFISDCAFSSCNNLTNISIPVSISKIGFEAFYFCHHLTNVYYSGTTEQWLNIEKETGFDLYTGNYIIYCTNGDITKQ